MASSRVAADASAVRRRVLTTKIPLALQRWALISMGARVRDHIDAAHFNFLTLVIAELNKQSETDLLRLLDETPYLIPRSARRASAFPRDFDVLAFADAYQKTLGAVRDARANLPRGTRAQKRASAHQEILPGASPEAVTRYTLMEPQEVALDYVCWKFKAGRSGAALKKQLQRHLSPRRLKQLRDAAWAEVDAVEALSAHFQARPTAQSAPSSPRR